MPRLDITALNSELKQGKIRPSYIIVGPEHYLAQTALKCIREAVCGEGNDQLNVSVFSGRDAKEELIFQALRTVTLLGGRPLGIVREGEAVQPPVLETLARYLESPVREATLVVVASKLDGRSRFMQVASKHAAIVDCKPLFDDKVPHWINMEFRRLGKQISHEAARFLADMVGNELGELMQAMERIALYIGGRKIVELADIEQVISETHQRTIFELTDAVGNRDLAKALAYLANILDGGQQPVMILNMLSRHFRILSRAKEIAGRMTDRSEVAKYLGVHPFYAKNYIDQARNFSGGEIRAGFRCLHRCDRELKSSRIPKERILEKAIFAIVRR